MITAHDIVILPPRHVPKGTAPFALIDAVRIDIIFYLGTPGNRLDTCTAKLALSQSASTCAAF
jgi:hypothetical protein